MVNAKAYFDYAASTPLDPAVREAMEPYLTQRFGNPGSVHSFGREALTGLDRARAQAADFLSCQPAEIIFTSGGTEANNLAIWGTVKSGDHIVTSAIEHPSVLEPCRQLERSGVEVTYLPVGPAGMVSVADVGDAIQPQTRLISLMYVNHELGTIQPVAEVGKLVSAQNQQRKKSRQGAIRVHTDAVQAAAYCPMNVAALGVDLLSLSAHKVYGPKGVGLLYRRSVVALEPRQFGGGQELGLRSGTPDVAAIVGFGRALELLGSPAHAAAMRRVAELQRQLMVLLTKNFKGCRINGDLKERIPGNLNVSFKGTDGPALLMLLDERGVAVSVGSACSAGSLDPSPVIMALGLTKEAVRGSVRISFGRGTTTADVARLVQALREAVGRAGDRA